MRQTAARLNRAWLTILGLLLLLAGLAVLLIGTGLLAPAARTVGLAVSRPTPSNHLFGAATASAFALTWVVLITALVGVVVGLLGLAWLVAQIPRSNEAKPFRLHDDPRTGLTRCEPSVLSDAVEEQVKALPGVQNASAVLRGTATEPDLTVKVTASDRTDLSLLLASIQNTVAVDLAGALDTRLRRLGVQLEVTAAKTRTDQITV
jgi:hypothetical protein